LLLQDNQIYPWAIYKVKLHGVLGTNFGIKITSEYSRSGYFSC